jgi:hypothetical protein
MRFFEKKNSRTRNRRTASLHDRNRFLFAETGGQLHYNCMRVRL